MIPENIRSLVSHLISETRNSKVKWRYNSYNSHADACYDDMNIEINYSFDYDSEVASLILHISREGRRFSFRETSFDSDYGRLLALYEEAMASDIGDFKF